MAGQREKHFNPGVNRVFGWPPEDFGGVRGDRVY